MVLEDSLLSPSLASLNLEGEEEADFIDAEEDAPYLWERQKAEPIKAFTAFAAYRDMGRERSIAKAYNAVSASSDGLKQPQNGPKTVPGFWKRWSRDYGWVHRAEAYDEHLDALVRAQSEADRAHDLEAFRQRRRGLAIAGHNITVRIFAAVNEALNKMERDGTDIEPKMIPLWVRAAVMLADAAALSEADALSVAEILALIQRDAA